MHVEERRQPGVWIGIVAAALVLLALILVVVIGISAQVRRTRTAAVSQPVPVATAPASPANSPPSSPSTAGVPAPSGTPASPGESPAPVRSQPVVVQQPVKVVEKQVKVVEKEVQIVEKPAQVLPKGTAGEIPPTGSTNPRPATGGNFHDTGLPNQITYKGKTWNASELVEGLPADLLTAGNQPVDGRAVYHDRETEAPYPHVYLRVSGHTDQYVRYVPTES